MNQLNQIPACSSCGRQDETLRIVGYPYVFSLVFITYRRTFAGIWCRRHRAWYQALASLITATAGWIGIPFGLLFTPVALYNLARGGYLPEEDNARMLKILGGHKLREGDSQGALRCFQAGLRFRDDETVRARLAELQGMDNSSAGGQTVVSQLLRVLAVLLGLGALGTAVGLADYAIAMGMSNLLQESNSLYLAILSWVPFVALAFLVGLLLSWLIDWTLASTRCTQWLLGAALAVAGAALAAYGLAEGKAIGMLATLTLFGSAPISAGQLVPTLGAVLGRGGAWMVLNSFRSTSTPDLIYLLILVVCAAYYGAVAVSTASRTVLWQQRIAAAFENVRLAGADAATNQPAMGVWAAIGSVALALGLLVSAFPQKGIVDYLQAADHRIQGNKLYEENKLDQAKVEFEEAIRLKPDMADARYVLSLVYYRTGKTDQAIAQLQTVADMNPTLASPHVSLGWFYSSNGDLAKSLQEFQAALRLDPNLADAHDGIGWAYIDNNDDLDKAVEEFQTALRLDPNLSHSYTGQGFVYYDRDDYKAARESFGAALKMNPQELKAHEGLGLTYQATHDLDKAIAEYDQTLKLSPDYQPAYFYQSMAYASKAEFAKAAEKLTRLAELHPDWGAPHAFLASVHYDMDQPDLMQQDIQKALSERGDDSNTPYALGTWYRNQRQFAEAEAQYLRAIQLSPKSENLYLELADVYMAQGKFDLALQMCDKALLLRKDYARAYVEQGSVLWAQQDLSRARQAVARALEILPDDDNAHVTLSTIAFFQGQKDQALQEAREGVKLNPYNWAGYRQLALALHARGQLDEALAAAEQAVKLAPKQDWPHYVLGLVYKDSGQPQKAAGEFETFLSLYWDRAYVRDFKTAAEGFLAKLR